ncbi:serine hydrolase [Caulobacter sp. KR2-114]|uniref:serine hydrolase n=1 Tax=Caulobacter sp. KR2-114 TaxID=3400912 RepID=UPI003BFC906A
MSPDRRHLLLGFAAALSACHHPVLGPARFDPKVLDKDAPALIARARPAAFAIGVMELKTQKVWYANGEAPFPLGGLAALPIAAALLSLADEHKLALTDKLTVRKADLAPPPSVIDQSWRSMPANFAMNITVQDLLTLALQYGDSTASDVLLGRAGGPGAVNAWLHDKGLTGLRVDRYARETGVQMSGLPSFRPEWRAAPLFEQALRAVPVNDRQKAMEAYVADPQDTASAQALIGLIYRLWNGDLLSRASSDLILRLMAPALGAVGPLGVAWPKGAAWAHKAADPRSDLGYTPIQGDAGLLTLKDGRRFAVTALLAGSTASETQRAQLFADTGRLMARAIGV